MHVELCPAQFPIAAQLCTGMQGFGGREVHCPQQFTARPLPSAVAQLLPARGQQLSLQQDISPPWPPHDVQLVTKSSGRPCEMELKPGAAAMTSTSSHSTSQDNRQPTATGYSWERWERQD